MRYIIVDHRIPVEAKTRLAEWGEVLSFEGSNEVYSAISSHPDIYIFQHPTGLWVAPAVFDFLKSKLQGIETLLYRGDKNPYGKFPDTTPYNVAYNSGLFIGNSKTADACIKALATDAQWIESPQSYARCNTLIINPNLILTSEITVKKALPQAFWVDPKSILLPGFNHGFIGGCAGFFQNKVLLLGSLQQHPQGEEIYQYLRAGGYSLEELYSGPLWDAGGIFVIE